MLKNQVLGILGLGNNSNNGIGIGHHHHQRHPPNHLL